MSWEDYKKKRNPDNTIQENENTNSTWENYKKNRIQSKTNNQDKQKEIIYSNDNTSKQRSNLILNNQNKRTVLSEDGNTIGNKKKIDTKLIAKAQNKDFIEGLTNIVNPNSWINKTISNDRMSNKEQNKTVENDNLLKLIQNANIAKEKQKEDINTDTQNTILPIPTNKTDKKASIWNKKVDTNGKEINNLTAGQQFEKSRRVLPIFTENVGIGASSVLPSIANYKNTVNQLSYEGLVNKGLVDYNADNIVYKHQEYLDKKENERSRKIEENINEILPYDNVSKKLATIAPSIGENLVSMGVGSVSPVLGSTSFMLSAAGNYLNDAKARGMSTDKAFGYATVMGIAEGGSEALISANMLSSAKKLITGTGISKKVLSSMGMNVGENFFQEAIMEPLQEATAQAIGGKDTANWNNIWGRMLESGLDGVLSALLLQGASVGIASSVSVMDKLNNKIVPTTQEYMKALVDIQNSRKVNTKEVINGAVIATIDGINENNTLNTKQGYLNNNSNTQTQQITPQQNKMSQNQTSEQIQLPIRNYQYIETENTKINNLRQDMSKYWTDTNETKTLGSVIEKIITDKGYNVRLDNTIKNQKGNSVNAQITTLNNGEVEIRINPNAKNVGEFLLMHETTHAIGTQEMKDLVMDYASKNTEFNNALESLKDTYGVQDVSDEVLADISGQLFGNQEFINNLSMEKPNIFKRIYNKIIELANKITGNSNEALFVRNLANKWQEAYRTQNNNLNNNNYYSIQTDSNGNKYVKVDTDQDIFEGIDEKDYPKIARMYMQDYLEGKTKLSNDDTVKIGNKGITKYTNPNQKGTYLNEKMQLSTELKNVLEIAQKDSMALPTKDTSKFPKWEYYKFNFELGGKTFEGTINIGIDKNGNKHFYEINKIHTTSNSYVSTSTFSSKDSINNSILPTNENVNSTTKYSMQESKNNSDSFNMKDNKGRILSKEQQNYFKNSKVRDENGNLKTLYHGTPYNFNIFNYSKLGENTSSLGAGFYFTDEEMTAKEYTRGDGNLKTVYVNIEKPMRYGKTTITKNEYKTFIKSIDKATNGAFLADYDGIENALMEYDYGGDDIDLVSSVQSASGLSWENIYKILKETTGYDGIISDKGFLNKDETIYVAFNSEQIKNVDNINPTNNMDIRYSKDSKQWQEYLNNNYKATGTRTNLEDIKLPTKGYFENKKMQEVLTDADYDVLNKIYEKEGKTEVLTERKKARLLEKYANDKFAIKDSIDILAQKFINKGHYIDQLSQKANNPELKFAYDRNLNSFAEGQYVVGVAQTDNQGNNIGKSINDIWKPIEDEGLTKEFSEYLLHKHNIDRSGRNKFIFGEEIGPTESTAIALELESKHPEFKEYSKDIKEFNHNNLNNLKEAGMLTQDTIDYIEAMYPNYIAISRNLEDNLYTGNNDKTGTRSLLKKATGGNADIQPIKETMAQQAIRIKRLINQNELGKELSKTLKNSTVDEGVDVSLSPTMLLDMDTMVDTDVEGNKYYLYFENGKQLKLKINDNLYESLKPTEISKIEKTLPVKALQKVNNMHRSLLTSSNPLFIVTNFFKDFQDGAFNSKYSSKFIKNYSKALNEIYTKGKYYESYMANGGMSNTYFDYETGIKKTNKFVEKIRNANEIVEQLPRLAEFISTLEDGKSLNEALYNAAEITTNFKRGGDITKAINRNGVNFLNASIQGLDKQFRNFSGQNGAKGYVNLLAKATIMSIIPAIFNHILLDDDEDYQDLPQSTKDLYYLFKCNDGKFIRIPKGRVLSIFGAAARRTLETVQGQDDAWDGFGSTIVNQVAPNNPLEDNILAPIMQVKNNKTWYGSDLVSSRLQKELPENQYDETTDNFSKWLGKQIKVSPKKINYLIDQYSGGIGDIILPMITPQAKQNVFIDKFTTDSVLKNKNVSKFYETLEKQTQIANDNFATDEDELQLKYLNSVSKDMSDLYKEKRQVQMSNISNKEKTKKVREIQEKINQLAEKGLTNYKNGSQNKNSSKIGDEEYYKNSNGEWTILTDEEKNKNTNISTETYSDYKQKVYNKKNEKVSNGELKKSQDLRTKDKIQILLDSKYAEKEKKAIYENYIKSSNDTEYDIMKQIGINFEQYLKYKQQDFESDKKDDGTTTGKTVSGSKKTKVYDYINNMNIDYNQKLVLLGTQYTLTSSEKSKLANYINELSIKKAEKLKIYEKLKGFTVYKDGRITW